MLIRGIIPTWPYFRLVNYCNLPRYLPESFHKNCNSFLLLPGKQKTPSMAGFPGIMDYSEEVKPEPVLGWFGEHTKLAAGIDFGLNPTGMAQTTVINWILITPV